ncbi:MAG: M20/M25/M40 family metallo-hydrolase [Candidatus Krumholzibacteriales bacterium]
MHSSRILTVCITLTLSLFFSCDNSSGISSADISRREIRSTIRFLGDDLLEGRAPGTRGGRLAENYIRGVLEILDIAPHGGSYFQEFTLSGHTLSRLSISLGGEQALYQRDVMGSYVGSDTVFSLEGELVFAGFGIISQPWSWDDYGESDLEGKILLVRVNEPGRDDPELFEGPALTYFGRWTYKIEEAARRGARGILLIHTTDSAGYGWQVVRNSWGGEELYLPSMLDNDLMFRGWIREQKLEEALAEKGISLRKLYGKSESRDFRPVSLGITARIEGDSRHREFLSRNVVGYIQGSDSELNKKSIILSAHIDHLGMDRSLAGDSIFNGAIDNGSAVASMMAAAKRLKEQQGKLNYSVIVLACNAEEAGLLGSRYFAGSVDPSGIVANINFESTPVWERARDFIAVGAKYSSLEDIIREIVREKGLEYSYFSMSNQGFFYRSDQFSFARRGIPAVWLSAGEDYLSGVNRLREFFLGDYHTVDDEFNPEWELESAIQTVEVTLDLIDYINREQPALQWKGRMTFPVER